MRVILCAFDSGLHEAWKRMVDDMDDLPESAGVSFELTRGDITELTVTAVVSPANSHGYMRGGVDLAYTRRFGQGLERSLRQKIVALPGAFLPVGEALVVETGDSAIPFLVSAPTMEKPMRLDDGEPVFAASRAAMRAALEYNFDSIAFPGMGTGTGGLSVFTAASHMFSGIAGAVWEKYE